jgi:hypothetical protein
MSYKTDAAHRVFSACGGRSVSGPCNWFVRDVARDLGIQLPGRAATGSADDMINEFRAHWASLSRHEAIKAAEAGHFIVAGLSSKEFGPRPIETKHQAAVSASRGGSTTAGTLGRIGEHGHVCVVVFGGQAGYPRIFSSSEDSAGGSRSDRHLAGQVFRHQDASNVEYFTPR